MHDDDLQPDHELASAFLDGDVTEAQRARVEASPELSALVVGMRDVRAQLADVPPVSATVRQAALDAMLAQFDSPAGTTADDDSPAVPAAAAVPAGIPPASNVVPMAGRRQWPKRVMSVAAGLLVVGAVGVAVGGGLGGSNSDSKSSSATALPKAADMTAAGQPERNGAPPPTIGSIMGAGSVAIEINDPQALLSLTAGYLSTVAGGGGETQSTTAAPATTAAALPADTTDGGLSSETFVPTVAADQSLPGELAQCAAVAVDDVSLGVISYQGTIAFAVLHPATGEVIAITSTCSVLASATP